MTQHTPGPWVATVGNRGTPCVISSEAWICGELSNGNGEHPGEAQANARLIAAAPDMLAALNVLVEICKHASFFAQCEEVALAEAVIAKAEGRP